MVSLTLSRLGLTDKDVLHLPGNLGQHMDTLGVAFNELTDIGLTALLTLAPALALLDLESNEIEFAPTSAGVDMLLRAERRLFHLDTSCNRFTTHSYIQFLWMTVRSRLEILDVVTSEQDTVQAPA